MSLMTMGLLSSTQRLTKSQKESTTTQKFLEQMKAFAPRIQGLHEFVSLHDAQYVPDKYIFAIDSNGGRVIVIDIEKQLPVKAIKTNDPPKRLRYVAETDEVWVMCWSKNITINIIGAQNGGISKLKDASLLVVKSSIKINVSTL